MRFPLGRPRRHGDDHIENEGRPIPDPAKVPTSRGTWEEAALTNVDITEVVKRQIRTVTRPWMK